MHRSGRGEATAKMAAISHGEDYSEESQSASKDMVRDNATPDHPLSYSDMSVFGADIKNTFSSAITELKADLLALTEKMAERAGHRMGKAKS